MQYTIKCTIEFLKKLFVVSTKNVICKLSSTYNEVDEEVITSVYCSDFKCSLFNNSKTLKDKYLNDIKTYFISNSCYENVNYLLNSMSTYIVFDLILHDRYTEGKVSKSDFAILIDLPVFEIVNQVNNKYEIKQNNFTKGILIQAKRTKIKGDYLGVDFKDLRVDKIKKFYSLCIYKFKVKENLFKLSDIKYIPIESNGLTDERFKKCVNSILKNKDFKNELSPYEFFDELINNDNFGTSSKEDINELISNKKYDIITLRIHFGDDGERKIKSELKRINNQLNNNLIIINNS